MCLAAPSLPYITLQQHIGMLPYLQVYVYNNKNNRTDKNKLTRTWREMLNTTLAEIESMIRTLLQFRMKKGGQQILVAYLDTTGHIKTENI